MKLIILTSLLYCLLLLDLGEAQRECFSLPNGCGRKRRQVLEEILAEVEEVERERREAHSHLAKATNHGTTTHGIATHKSPAAHDQHAAGLLSYGHLAGEQRSKLLTAI